MKGLKAHRAQSVLEYVILVTVVVGAIILGISALGIKADKDADQTKGLGKMLYQMNEKMKTDSKQVADMVK